MLPNRLLAILTWPPDLPSANPTHIEFRLLEPESLADFCYSKELG